ncbi:acetyl esterase/lipase [Sphingomonas sp. PP-F2F-A104-K0414]|uniref:alpha/beta hydrolase n=1 Tax=Sphingomonas sp. PP-F2F-A104-K0414 TaxID=2135661 RepID=UPI001050E3CD|nr:alpha/beta hydrolase [Sphingomonas sp. PP-F2F-A104-K0414]TCP96327.1 acetyl esterase/lipase [Sphingomonas sp. PP-F2F-A104-K0414]
MSNKQILKWASVAGVGLLAATAVRRARLMRIVPRELRSALLMVPLTFSPSLVAILRRVTAVAPASKMPAGMRMTEHWSTGDQDRPPVRIVVLERAARSVNRPVMLWMHGGGYVIGTPEQDIALLTKLLARLDIVIVSVDYRLAPEHPFPAPLDDCHTALEWLTEHASELAIDTARVAVGGQSAGGGLAAALVQRAVDAGPVSPVFQLLVYPMLDNATTAVADHGDTGLFGWTPESNYFGWTSYLGGDPTTKDHAVYSVPASRIDLCALPPAWIGVGTLDLFHDEDAAYGERLRQAGVSCTTHITEGGYHGFDILKPNTVATERFHDSMVAALKAGLAIE